jgi:hypothetical protein
MYCITRSTGHSKNSHKPGIWALVANQRDETSTEALRQNLPSGYAGVGEYSLGKSAWDCSSEAGYVRDSPGLLPVLIQELLA